MLICTSESSVVYYVRSRSLSFYCTAKKPLTRHSQADTSLHDQRQSPSCETGGLFLSQITYLQNTVSLVLLFYGYFVYSQRHFILEVQLKL